MSQWNSSQRGHKGSRSVSGGGDERIAAACLRVVDLGLGVVIFVGPHLLGGRHLLGRFAIVGACVVTAIAWFVGQYFNQQAKWHRASGLGILILAIGVVTLQLVPLPDEWLATLSPRISKILPLWHANSSGLQIGGWHTISLSPEDTRLALATLLAYAMLFVTAVQRLDSVDDIKRIFEWTAWSAVIVAAFGIVQYFTANGKFFWVYEYPYTDTLENLKAGFTCRNHFAHFLVLGLCCLLAVTMLHRNRDKISQKPSRSSTGRFQLPGKSSRNGYATHAQSIAIVVLVFAVLASLSRGAVLAMLAAIAVMGVCYATAGLLRSKHVAAAGIVGVILMIALSLTGDYEYVTSRLEGFTSRSLDDLDESGGRRLVWSANMAAFQDGWLTGSGAGSHRFVYPLYLQGPIANEFTHAENGYLQVATENGLLGVVLLAATLLSCGYWCFSAMRHAGQNRTQFILAGGVTAALTASVVHSLVDFVWFIPACATVTILMAACALRLTQLAEISPVGSVPGPSLGKLSRFNMSLATSLAGVWALTTLWPSALTSLEWDGYLLADKASQNAQMRQLSESGTAAEVLTEAEHLNSQSSLVHLSNVIRKYPQSGRAHVRLAGCLLSRFENLQQKSDNPMSIGQIREAAQASHFTSSQALHEWLNRAFGSNCRLLYQARYHASRAAALCPLQGEAYVYLAELSFLEGRDTNALEAYSQQGLLVRPQEPDVLFAVGKRHLIDGNVDQALLLWSKAYRGAGRHQYLINRVLAGDMTAANFIKVFQPSWTSLQNLWATYRDSGKHDELNTLLPYASREALRQVASLPAPSAGMVWWGLAWMQKDLGQQMEALKSLELAYAAHPDNFGIRYDLGKCLADFEKYELAESHLRWCLGQSPENAGLRAELLKLSRVKMQRIARSTTTNVQKR
jgi:O-antigen ligase/tetratricopeptide (TPR) repeat protein